MNPLLQRIAVDPNSCFGKPCIKGTRIWVSLILDLLASGMSLKELLGEYPQLTEEDIRAAIAYGAEMSRERFVDVPAEPANEVQARLTTIKFLHFVHSSHCRKGCIYIKRITISYKGNKNFLLTHY